MKKTKNNQFYIGGKHRYGDGFAFTVEHQRDFEDEHIGSIFAKNAIQPFGRIHVIRLNICSYTKDLQDIIEIMENFEEYVAHLK